MVSVLLDYYVCLSMEPFQCEVAATVARTCCLLYSALSKMAADAEQPKHWIVKPKFHMWVELAEYQSPDTGNPSFHWTYPDEDFVGWVAKLAASRGGPKQACTIAKAVLTKYRTAW